MTAAARTGIVVVNYGSHALLDANLRVTVSGSDAVVVVVDSYSGHDERAHIARLAHAAGWHLVAPSSNVGFGIGMNLGVARAVELGATRLVLLNPDLALSGTGLDLLLARVDADGAALVAPRIVRPDGRPWASGCVDLLLSDGTMRSSGRRAAEPGHGAWGHEEWLSGACLALSADLWRRAGGFDQDYFLYWEDVDFSRRVQLAGGHLVVELDALAVHDEGSTHGPGAGVRAKSETYYYFNIRNRFVYATKWLTAPDRRRWVRTTPRAVRAVVLQGGRRQLFTSIAPWRAIFRGVRDGWGVLRSGGKTSPQQ
ncbi:N-acetylglucosaminyl-diphospho-decaprenol L-rhamnosyltransferase [mine drainage metagenome]|uniref:N-acetylglucosaminyl-diphospho-decaprenol L-rhamnosyltransferase n=1 Tax=mine drainage metagenome TaxID=410659 RepID=A0A1J5S5I6_9ZZZZ